VNVGGYGRGRGRVVGRVAGLWRYPVKSMAPERLAQADVSWHGLAGDRRWGFLDQDRAGSGFPWVTLRQRPDLVHFRPSLREPDRPERSAIGVTTPAGDVLDVADPALAASLGGNVRAVKQDRGTFDAMPLSLITTRTVADLAEVVGRDLAVERFRPNVLVETWDDMASPEDTWVGSTLSIGDGDGAVQLRVDARDTRCVIVGIDPATAERDRSILPTIVKERGRRVGVYGSTVRPGALAIGDLVRCDQGPGLQQ
jgi:uncharacterized protein YcbX